MKKSYFIYAPVTLSVFTGGILIAGGNLLMFWDPASLMLVFLPPLFLLLAVFGPRGIIDAFSAAFENNPVSRIKLEKGIVFFAMAHRIFLLSGFIGTLTGALLILYGISKSQSMQVALYVVIAFMTVYYSMLMVLIVTVPFKAALEKRLIEVS